MSGISSWSHSEEFTHSLLSFESSDSPATEVSVSCSPLEERIPKRKSAHGAVIFVVFFSFEGHGDAERAVAPELCSFQAPQRSPAFPIAYTFAEALSRQRDACADVGQNRSSRCPEERTMATKMTKMTTPLFLLSSTQTKPSPHHPAPFLLPSKTKTETENSSKVEILKENSDYLRHPLMEELVTPSLNISEDAAQLMKFHGSYQQDDREKRGAGKGKAYQFMMRTRQPAGRVSNRLYLTMDDLADHVGNGTLRLTTRQAYQLHGEEDFFVLFLLPSSRAKRSEEAASFLLRARG